MDNEGRALVFVGESKLALRLEPDGGRSESYAAADGAEGYCKTGESPGAYAFCFRASASAFRRAATRSCHSFDGLRKNPSEHDYNGHAERENNKELTELTAMMASRHFLPHHRLTVTVTERQRGHDCRRRPQHHGCGP